MRRTEPSVCTQYWGIFSADTSQAGMHTLYLHSQRNWQMVGDKRSIPWSCRRTISTDTRFQSLKITVQQPNHSTAQHSARSKAGAWNVCQDSLIQTCLVSKMEINLANECGMLLQRDRRAIIWCRTEYNTLSLWLFGSWRTDLYKIVPLTPPAGRIVPSSRRASENNEYNENVWCWMK